ncbi:MAG: hypothetical protein JO062_01610 [Bryobacterales bacterium]|nr:hypothetical protein [Bryobacterales bacterium]
MAVMHITEAELARDIHAVLEKVEAGAEVVVERENRPVAVMKPASQAPGRTLSESIAIARQRERDRGYAVTLEPEFASDVEEIVRKRQLWNPAPWD